MPLPKRCGKEWDDDEERLLLQHVHENKSFTDIGILFHRTDGEIRIKMHDIVYRMYLRHEDISEISRVTKFSPVMISTIIEYKRLHDFKNPPKTQVDASTVVCNLVKYNSSLEEICNITELTPDHVIDILNNSKYVDTTRRTIFEQSRMM
jgi:predicted transcriptional regulator with HTH domain